MADVLLQKLPDPFLKSDGKTRVANAEEWRAQREWLVRLIVGMEYGGMPPRPDKVTVEPLNDLGRGSKKGPRQNVVRVHCGTAEHPFSFVLNLYVPESTGRLPVVLTGDGCYMSMSNEVIYEINRRGMIAARFDRLELATDRRDAKRDHGLYAVYPRQTTFSALCAWAWGYQRALDAIEQLDFCDASKVAITGHSRGGKTVLLAGATDERFYIVNPNDSGAGGAGCFRYHMDRPDAPEGVDKRSETLEDLMRAIPYWFAPAMHAYVGREEALPFDQHMLKACVAPRYLLQTEGLDDTWANPKGSYQTLLAAREVYKLLGAEDHIAAYYREGGHAHGYREYIQLLDFMQACLRGERAPEYYYEHPYPEMENIFDWACPGKD